MSDLTARPATTEELLKHLDMYIKRIDGCRVMRLRYRHGVSEQAYRRGKHGVRHVQYSNSRVTVKDGKPYVTRNGCLLAIVGTYYTLTSTGQTFVADVRVAGIEPFHVR